MTKSGKKVPPIFGAIKCTVLKRSTPFNIRSWVAGRAQNRQQLVRVVKVSDVAQKIWSTTRRLRQQGPEALYEALVQAGVPTGGSGRRPSEDVEEGVDSKSTAINDEVCLSLRARAKGRNYFFAEKHLTEGVERPGELCFTSWRRGSNGPHPCRQIKCIYLSWYDLPTCWHLWRRHHGTTTTTCQSGYNRCCSKGRSAKGVVLDARAQVLPHTCLTKYAILYINKLILTLQDCAITDIQLCLRARATCLPRIGWQCHPCQHPCHSRPPCRCRQ